jgi:hypothetical protein
MEYGRTCNLSIKSNHSNLSIARNVKRDTNSENALSVLISSREIWLCKEDTFCENKISQSVTKSIDAIIS